MDSCFRPSDEQMSDNFSCSISYFLYTRVAYFVCLALGSYDRERLSELVCWKLLTDGESSETDPGMIEQKLGGKVIIATTFTFTVIWLDINVELLMRGALNADTLSSGRSEESGSDVTAATTGFIKSVQTAAIFKKVTFHLPNVPED